MERLSRPTGPGKDSMKSCLSVHVCEFVLLYALMYMSVCMYESYVRTYIWVRKHVRVFVDTQHEPYT